MAAMNGTDGMLDVSALAPGDVLLMLGKGELSKMIAWCGDSIYSHAAMVADEGDLIEASASGVRRYPLAKRLQDVDEYFFVDAYQPHTREGNAFTTPDRAAVLAHAVSLLSVPYPLDSLATLGVLVAIRGKWPQHWLARMIVREALDRLVGDNPSHMVCSEVVYRALAECSVEPPGRLAPVIVLSGPSHLPFPEVDWKALWDEVWPLLRPARQQALAGVATRLPTGGLGDAGSVDWQVADADLASRTNAARATLGLPPLSAASFADQGSLLADAAVEPPGTVLPNPNPKLVMPLDLANSPSNQRLGRLMQAPDAAP